MLFLARIVIADEMYSGLKELSYYLFGDYYFRSLLYNKYITWTNLLQLEKTKLNQKIITIIIN